MGIAVRANNVAFNEVLTYSSEQHQNMELYTKDYESDRQNILAFKTFIYTSLISLTKYFSY